VAVAGGSRRSPAWTYTHGHQWVELCTDIAKGEATDAHYKRRYNLTPKQVQAFAVEYADQIAEIGQAIARSQDKAVAGLWVTKKQARLAELQADVEDVQSLIDECRDESGKLNVISIMAIIENKQYLNLVRIKRALLSSVADEIDGPRRQVEVPVDERKVVSYIIDTGDVGENLT
jgi:hypothetical protein